MEARGWKYLIVGSVITAAIGWAIPRLIDEFVPFLSDSGLARYPMETAALAAVTFMIGFWVGRRSRLEPRESFIRRMANRRHEGEEVDERNRKDLAAIPYDIKSMVKTACEKGAVYCSNETWRYDFSYMRKGVEQFLTPSYISGERVKLTPTDLAKDTMERYGDIFDCVTEETIKTHAKQRDVVAMYFSSGIEWWWHE